MKTQPITSYYLDDNNTLHTWIDDYKHITISDVLPEQVDELINELNEELN